MLKKLVWGMLMIFVLNLPTAVLAQATASDTGYIVSDNIIENEYKLGPGDQVAANLIIGENDMSLDYLLVVGPDGKIFIPKVGEIELLGLTIPEGKKLIDQKIKEVYKEKFTFSFRLVQPRKVQIYLSGSDDKPLYLGEKKFVYVYGQVQRSGRFEYLSGKKFSDYISFAGGPTAQANFSASTITRGDKQVGADGSDIIFNGRSEKDIEVMPGDVINVPAQFFYFSDFTSFTSLVFTTIALYKTVFSK
ncbi:MAG: polysaccharide biosynthesis/export family protein [Candidatus Margulisiibacteriota bacterium]